MEGNVEKNASAADVGKKENDEIESAAADKTWTSIADNLEDLDPVALAELGTRRGSRFSADGTPLFLKAFLGMWFISRSIGVHKGHSGIFNEKLPHAQKMKCSKALKKGRKYFFIRI